METALFIRAILINFYKRWQDVFDFIFKFYVGLLLFGIIGSINMSLPELSRIDSYFAGGMSLVLIAFVFTILPTTGAFALLALDIAVQTSSHIELSVLLLMLMICLLLFYVRNAPKESWLIILTVLGFYYRVPYIAPIVAGLYFPLTGAIPIIIGIYIWEFAPRVIELMKTTPTAGFDVVMLTETAGPSVSGIMSVATDNLSWVFISFVFAMTVLIVYVVSHLTMDYSKELSVVFGGLLCMIGLFLVQYIADIDLGGGMIAVFSILSVLLMLGVVFFDLALDYKKAERVEFSDDDNYYYVRIVPKLIVTGEKTEIAKGKEPKTQKTRENDFYGRYKDDNNEDNYDDEDMYDDEDEYTVKIPRRRFTTDDYDDEYLNKE